MHIKVIKNSFIVLVLMIHSQVFSILSMQNNEQPIVFALRLQDFRKRTQEKNAFKIKMRRMMPERGTSSRLNSMKRKRSKRRSKKADRVFFCKQNLNSVAKKSLELPVEATLTTEMLRTFIQDKDLRVALDEKKLPEVIRAELERIMQGNVFTNMRKGPFRVPHCYNHLSRILMQAKRLQLLPEERESLKALLVASQLTQEELEEINRAFQLVSNKEPLCINGEIWNQKILDLAVDCDGKSLLERAYETGDEEIINSVKSIQKNFLMPIWFVD